ncbi:hypothetical protein NSR99_23255, partial [Salmonella enterica]|nr:hypothetical protein [Salmonella enterica]
MSEPSGAHVRAGFAAPADPRRGALGYAAVLALLIVSYGLCAAQPGTVPSPWAFLAMLVTVAIVFRVTRAHAL